MIDRDFERLWDTGSRRFEPEPLTALPDLACRYLGHAVAPATPLASVVRLKMHGHIKLGQTWAPFDAEQIIARQHGFIWRAHTRLHHLPITGSDRWVDGVGSMRWKLFGVLPVVSGTGADVTRSSLGRAQIESVWLPTLFVGDGVRWSSDETSRLGIELTLANNLAHLDLVIGDRGQLRSVQLSRWGNPIAGSPFGTYPFGAHVSQEATFAGITIPTMLRVGWFITEDGFERDGEFFRVTIDHAEFC